MSEVIQVSSIWADPKGMQIESQYIHFSHETAQRHANIKLILIAFGRICLLF